MRLPLRVLVLCTANSARSQIAEALLRARSSGRVEARSAGATPAPQLHSGALQVLEEHGIPASGQRPKMTDEVLGLGWDVVITVCDQAKDACPVLPGATLAVHWGMDDPAEGPNERQAFATAYQLLSQRVDELLALPLAELSPDELREKLEQVGTPHLSTGADTAS